MVSITDCAFCKNRIEKLKDGWIPCCKAYPEGRPLNFDYSNLRNKKSCNKENGIGFELKK